MRMPHIENYQFFCLKIYIRASHRHSSGTGISFKDENWETANEVSLLPRFELWTAFKNASFVVVGGASGNSRRRSQRVKFRFRSGTLICPKRAIDRRRRRCATPSLRTSLEPVDLADSSKARVYGVSDGRDPTRPRKIEPFSSEKLLLMALGGGGGGGLKMVHIRYSGWIATRLENLVYRRSADGTDGMANSRTRIYR